jgi:predicted hydrolase (HD superfamily)
MPITYDQAVAKLDEWTDSPALRCHARAVEAAMRLASHRYGDNQDENQWGSSPDRRCPNAVWRSLAARP